MIVVYSQLSTMMANTITTKCLMLLMGQVLVSTVITAELNVLETTIMTEKNEAITLKWVETQPFLANENLPVWTTTQSHNILKPDFNTMKEIGKFQTYHDLEKSSAVVLIEEWNCIFGVIDVRYDIVCLPLDKLHHYHKIGESPYIAILQGVNTCLDHLKPLDLSKKCSTNSNQISSNNHLNNFQMLIKTIANRDEPSTSCSSEYKQYHKMNMHNIPHDDSSSNKRQRMNWNYVENVIIVYPEILIIIPYEISSTARKLSTLVLQDLVQFNAVAMLFAKLAKHGIKIHINIAGIIIEKAAAQLPFTHLSQNGNLNGQLLLTSMINYIKNVKETGETQKLFSDDSIDMFLISTTNAWNEKDVYPSGLSTEVFDILSNRKLKTRVRDRKILGSLVNRSKVLQYYVNAAHEIAHLMTVEDDPSNSGLCYNGEQCHGIMQKNGQHCLNCLTWSPTSINHFKQYLSTNTNRCFLRNLPRSLHRYGQPRISLYPADQCLCYGYYPDWHITHILPPHRDNPCRLAIQCIGNLERLRIQHGPLPIDGTPCENNNKVCWNKKCVQRQ